MDYDFDFWTIRAMVDQGGSFVKCLGALASHADRKNLALVKATWPEYWEDYHEQGQKMRFETCSFGECDGSGEVSTDESDGEGHIMAGVGTQKCRCVIENQEHDADEDREEGE